MVLLGIDNNIAHSGQICDTKVAVKI